MREMKDSGIEWIGEIPADWEIVKTSYLYDITLGKMVQPEQRSETDTLENYLCAANVGKNKLKLTELKQMWISEAEKKFLEVKKGDLLVVEGGDVASSDIIHEDVADLYFQNALHRVRGINGNDNRFLRYMIMTAKASGHIDLICNKATIAHFSKEKFEALRIVTPSIAVQNQISNYLDKKCGSIDSLAQTITAQIETLGQYKRSVITEAVTKGLDPDAEMKDSGVDWFPSIPSSWCVGRLKDIIFILTDYTANGSFGDLAKNVQYLDYEDYARLVRLTDLRECFDNMGVYVDKHAYEYLAKSSLLGGEILVANVGAYAGLFCEMPMVDFRATLGPNMYMIKTNSTMLQHYLYYLGIASFVWEQLRQKSISSAQPKLNKTDVKTVYIPIPPVTEQHKIAAYLDKKCKFIDNLIQAKQDQLVALDEYKKSLIYEYVTGKKEVPAS